MSNVTLSIGERTFTVACAEGEEDHIRGLGQLIDSKLQDMGDLATQSEGRMLLFAALLLADEIHELRGKVAVAQAGPDAGTAQRLGQIAGQLENLASRLEA
ncbi:MAG: cell division protein ZapA [Sphingomonadaceae bacterium]